MHSNNVHNDEIQFPFNETDLNQFKIQSLLWNVYNGCAKNGWYVWNGTTNLNNKWVVCIVWVFPCDPNWNLFTSQI